jgi:ATP-dependent RNA helicase SUPV3L1/SUV3
MPLPGAAALATPADPEQFEAFARAGYRPLGAQMLRVDLAERLARIAHDGRTGRAAFAPDAGLAISLGLRHPSFAQLMLALGFRPAGSDSEQAWVWRGPRPPRPPSPPRPGNAFGALAALRLGDG